MSHLSDSVLTRRIKILCLIAFVTSRDVDATDVVTAAPGTVDDDGELIVPVQFVSATLLDGENATEVLVKNQFVVPPPSPPSLATDRASSLFDGGARTGTSDSVRLPSVRWASVETPPKTTTADSGFEDRKYDVRDDGDDRHRTRNEIGGTEERKRRPYVEIVIEETYPELGGVVFLSGDGGRGRQQQFEIGDGGGDGDGHFQRNLEHFILSAFRDGDDGGSDEEAEEQFLRFRPSTTTTTTTEVPRTTTTVARSGGATWKLTKDGAEKTAFLNSEAHRWLRRPSPSPRRVRRRRPPSRVLVPPPPRPPLRRRPETAVKNAGPFLSASERDDYDYDDGGDEEVGISGETDDDEYYDDDYEYDGPLDVAAADGKATEEFVRRLKDDGGETVASQQFYPSPFIAAGKSKNEIVLYDAPTAAGPVDEAAVAELYRTDPMLRDAAAAAGDGGFASEHGLWDAGRGEVVRFVHYRDDGKKKPKDGDGGGGGDGTGRRGLRGRLSGFFSRMFSGR